MCDAIVLIQVDVVPTVFAPAAGNGPPVNSRPQRLHRWLAADGIDKTAELFQMAEAHLSNSIVLGVFGLIKARSTTVKRDSGVFNRRRRPFPLEVLECYCGLFDALQETSMQQMPQAD